jgi:hypothetical protein
MIVPILLTRKLRLQEMNYLFEKTQIVTTGGIRIQVKVFLISKPLLPGCENNSSSPLPTGSISFLLE